MKFAPNIGKFTILFIDGLILILINLEELTLKNTLKLLKIFSKTLKKMNTSLKILLNNISVIVVKLFWPTDMLKELVLIVNIQMLKEINVMVVEN